MEREKETFNIAYIDGTNLDKALKSLAWELDYARFYVWLKEKYGVERAYIFIGFMSKYKDIYTYLQESGFTLSFKEVIYKNDGRPKGNCDSDLIVQAIEDLYEGPLDQAIIVASDGDYTPLIKKLQKGGKIRVILSPGLKDKCSVLLKRTGVPISYINDQRGILELKRGSKNEKAPDADKTA